MTGSAGAAETAGEAFLVYPGGVVSGIHASCFRIKDCIDAFLAAELLVAGKVARIAGQVLIWAKLGWIDKDAHHDAVGMLPGQAY